MVKEQLESLVFNVVLSQADEGEVRRLPSGTIVLDVDQLTMTHIVLALETQLGFELPTYLEDARTVAELVTGTLDVLCGVLPLQTMDRPTAPRSLVGAAGTALA